MAINKKIIAFLIGLAVFGFVAAPQPAQAFSWGAFAGQVDSIPQTVFNWFGSLFSDIFGKKNPKPISEPAIQPPVESTAATVEINPEIDEKLCQQDSDCVLVAGRDENNHCCSVACENEAINRNSIDAREKRHSLNCKDEDYKNCADSEDIYCEQFLTDPFCNNGQCDLRESPVIENTPIAASGNGKNEEIKKTGIAISCGDGICEAGETADNCAKDCGPAACIGESKTAFAATKIDCCPGLQKKWLSKGTAQDVYICTKCGNSLCENGESGSDFPQAYNNAGICVKENDIMFAAANDRDCCSGLQKIWLSTEAETAVYICTNCGDGKCAKNGENTKNCPKDCYCGNGTCDSGESDVACAKDCKDQCAQEGKSVNKYSEQCCSGLVPAPWGQKIDSNGVCENQQSLEKTNICVNCGDGVCGKYESKCSCPKDCDKTAQTCRQACGAKGYAIGRCGEFDYFAEYESKEIYLGQTSDCSAACYCQNCAKAGETMDKNSSLVCCAGLNKIADTGGYINYSCAKPESSSFVCANCGDGILGPGENKCNCPNDYNLSLKNSACLGNIDIGKKNADDEKFCCQDSDCVETGIRDDDKCCGSCGTEAISKAGLEKRQAWSQANCKGYSWQKCPMFECAPANQELTKPVCVGNKCEMAIIERAQDCVDEACRDEFALRAGDFSVCDKNYKDKPCFDYQYFDCLESAAKNKKDKKMCSYMDSKFGGVCDTINGFKLNKAAYAVNKKASCLDGSATKISDCYEIPEKGVYISGGAEQTYRDSCIKKFTKIACADEAEKNALMVNDKKFCCQDKDCDKVGIPDPSHGCCTVCGSDAVNSTETSRLTEFWTKNCLNKNYQCPNYNCSPTATSLKCVDNKCTLIPDK